MKNFNVILFDFNKRGVEYYDVLPYFRMVWKDKKFNFDANNVKTFADMKKWIEDVSQYQFWSRCEYECLVGPWPYIPEKLEDELQKIDVHEQILANIDIITEILFNELVKK